MGSFSGRTGCCHICGCLLTFASVLLLIGGFILLVVFSSDFDKVKTWSTLYSIGIAAIALGTLTSILTVIYFCVAFRHGWNLYGCFKIKIPSKTISQSMMQLPSKDQLNGQSSGTVGSGHSRMTSESGLFDKPQPNTSGYRYSAYDIQRQQSMTAKRETDWDPNTILHEDDEYL